MSVTDPPVERIYLRLVNSLGPHTTRLALKTFAAKAVGVGPEEVTAADAPDLVRGLRPLLRSMLGDAQAEALVTQRLGDLR